MADSFAIGPQPDGALITPHERDSALWRKIKKHFEARLELARARNDSNLDAARTAKLRGAIGEMKYLVALDKPAPQREADELFKD